MLTALTLRHNFCVQRLCQDRPSLQLKIFLSAMRNWALCKRTTLIVKAPIATAMLRTCRPWSKSLPQTEWPQILTAYHHRTSMAPRRWQQMRQTKKISNACLINTTPILTKPRLQKTLPPRYQNLILNKSKAWTTICQIQAATTSKTRLTSPRKLKVSNNVSVRPSPTTKTSTAVWNFLMVHISVRRSAKLRQINSCSHLCLQMALYHSKTDIYLDTRQLKRSLRPHSSKLQLSLYSLLSQLVSLL